jgi:hypothetical protein
MRFRGLTSNAVQKYIDDGPEPTGQPEGRIF